MLLRRSVFAARREFLRRLLLHTTTEGARAARAPSKLAVVVKHLIIRGRVIVLKLFGLDRALVTAGKGLLLE